MPTQLSRHLFVLSSSTQHIIGDLLLPHAYIIIGILCYYKVIDYLDINLSSSKPFGIPVH